MNISNLEKKIEEKRIAKDELNKQIEKEQNKFFLFKNDKKISGLNKQIQDLDEEIANLEKTYNSKLEQKEAASKTMSKVGGFAKRNVKNASIGFVSACVVYTGYLYFKPLNVNGEQTTYRAMVESFEDIELNASDYTPETYERFMHNLQEAEAQKSYIFLSDEEKLSYINALSSSYDTLELIPDKTALLAALKKANKYDTSPYIPVSVESFKSEIARMQKIYDDENATGKEVSSAEKVIDDAYKALILKADKTKLTEIYKKYSDFALDEYTPSSIKNFNEQLSLLKKVIDDANALQATVDKEVETKANMESFLVKKADKTKLLEIYNKYTDFPFDQYIPSSVKSFKEQLDSLKKVIDDEDASQAEVDKEAESKASIENYLVKKADKSVLQSLINEFNGLNSDNYKSGFDELKSEVEAVEPLLSNDEVTQEAVNAAVARLQTAKGGLVEYSVYVYRVNMYASETSNNSVGSDWSFDRYVNGQYTHDGFEITSASGGYATVEMLITEHDSVPESGYGSATIALQDGFNTSFNITVVENRGRYSGNVATFTVTVKVAVIGRQ